MKAMSIEECQKIMVTLPPIKRYLTKNMCHWTWPIEKAIKFPTTQAPFMGFAGHFMDPALHAHSDPNLWMDLLQPLNDLLNGQQNLNNT